MNETYYTVPEVAELLKVKKAYVYDLINFGKLKAIKLSERRTRVPASALDELSSVKIDNYEVKNYNKNIVQPPKRGRKSNGAA